MGGSLGGGRPTAGRRHGGSRGKADPGQATPLGAAPEDPHGEAKVVSPLGTGAANGARGGSRDGGWRGRGARWGAGRACWGRRRTVRDVRILHVLACADCAVGSA